MLSSLRNGSLSASGEAKIIRTAPNWSFQGGFAHPLQALTAFQAGALYSLGPEVSTPSSLGLAVSTYSREYTQLT